MRSAGAQPSVLVTGASSGIGRACALLLDRRGVRVFAGVRRPADGEALAARAGPGLQPVVLDVTVPASLAAAAKELESTLAGRGLDGLVNNAGVVVAAPLEELELDALRRQLEVNVLGTVAATQAFLPLLRRGPGRIVTVGSILGRLALPFLAPYCASKAALAALCDALRLELRPWNIPVVLVEPGSVATPIWDKAGARADALPGRWSASGRGRYLDAFRAMQHAAQRRARTGVPAEAVARTVARALVARHPRSRYVLGRDARLEAKLVRLLPTRLRDALLAGLIGLPGAGSALRRPGDSGTGRGPH